jgi:hypothetical protein
LTVLGSGIAAAIAGPALIAVALPLAAMPIYKYFKDERITADEMAKDVALSGTIGAVTGPIGSGGSALARTSTGITKFLIRTTTSSVAGAVGGAIAKGARFVKGEIVTVPEVVSAMKAGALVGTVGGVTGEIANGITSNISGEIVRGLSRVGITGATSAATDAGVQYYENGTVDGKQVMINAAGQMVVAATAETSAAVSQRTTAYNNKVNDQLLRDRKVTPEQAQEIKEVIKEANSLKKGAIDKSRYAGERNFHQLARDRKGQIGECCLIKLI